MRLNPWIVEDRCRSAALLPLPPAAPELNPAERVQLLRKTYTDLLVAIQDAGRKLTSQVGRIT